MSLMSTMREPRKITGLHVLAILIGFFLTVTGVNVLMMYSAITTFGGLETDDAYRKGLAYNQTIAQGEAQAALGWTALVMAAPDQTSIWVEMTGKTEAPLTGITIKGEIGRAATNKFDMPLTFRETAPGHYEAALDTRIESGNWVAHLSAVKAHSHGPDTVFEIRQRLWIAP